MTTVRHDPTPNGIHRCPFPETGCTGRTCDRRESLSVGAVFAAIRQVSSRIASIPLAWCYTCDQYASDACARDRDHSLRKPPQGSTAPLHGDADRLTRLLMSGITSHPEHTPSVSPWSAPAEPLTAESLRAAAKKAIESHSWEPQPVAVHPGAYADAAAGRCTCRWTGFAWPFPCDACFPVEASPAPS